MQQSEGGEPTYRVLSHTSGRDFESGEAHRRRGVNEEVPRGEEPEPAGLATEVQLRPYQRQSLSFVLQMERSTSKALAGCRTFTGSPLSLIRGGWVADEVGMGKTAVAIAVVLANPSKAPRPSDKAWYQHEYAKYKTTLVVVPRLTSRWNLSADPPPVCTFPCTFDCTFPCIASAAAKAHRCLFARAFAAC